MSHVVPEAVQRAAAAVLAVQREKPLEGVTGLAVAERLAEGSVEERDIVSLHRFFLIHDRHHLSERQLARDASCSALCRSWELRGAERGRAWADRIYRGLVGEGKVRVDPYDDLMRADVDEVYAMFGSGAYGWEFGLDTMDKAARFVEDYHRATGHILDLQKAFGESGKAVATAMLRRTSKPDPMILGRQLQDSYPIAIRDTDALAEAMGDRLVFETMRSANMPTIRMARGISWPEWVAYCATASEVGVEAGPLSGKWQTTHTPRPNPLHEYDGVTRTYFTFFHPEGPGYVDDKDTEHEGIHEELENWLSVEDPDTDRDYLIDLTERLMHWCAITGRTASLARVYVEAWKARDWSTIADSLPLDSPHRVEFLRLSEDRGHADALGSADVFAGQPQRPSNAEDWAQWEVGDVIQNGNRTYHILAQDEEDLVLVPLFIADGMHNAKHSPGKANARDYENYRRVLHGFLGLNADMISYLAPHITVELPLVKMTEVPSEWGNIGDELQLDDNVAYLLGAVRHVDGDLSGRKSNRIRVVAARPSAIVGIRRDSEWGSYWSIELVAASVIADPVNHSYSPPMYPQERMFDGPNDEQGHHRMVATSMAMQYAERTGAEISKDPMPFLLGSRFKLDDETKRTVIGFASKGDKSGYIIVSEKGNLTWKSAERAHKEFLPEMRDGFVQSVITNSLPHPDAAEKEVENWRRANYRLNDKAKRLAKKHEWVLRPSSADARFLVGVPLRWRGQPTSILCWITQDAQTVAVLDDETDNGDEYLIHAELDDDFSIVYETKSSVDKNTNSATFGRLGDTINVIHEDFAMPTSVNELEIQPIQEPAFAWIPKRDYVAVAIIGTVPAGTKFTFKGKIHQMPYPGFVLTRPLGVTDYNLAIPRTPIQTYEPTARTAVEAVQRQTGIAMQPHSHLGDFPSGLSVTRVYSGKIVAGDPHLKREVGEGTDAVVIVSLDELGEPMAWIEELVSATGDRWQIDALVEAIAQLDYNMVPADYFVRVTGPQDTRSGQPVPALQVMGQGQEQTKNRAVFVSRPLTVVGGTGKL